MKEYIFVIEKPEYCVQVIFHQTQQKCHKIIHFGLPHTSLALAEVRSWELPLYSYSIYCMEQKAAQLYLECEGLQAVLLPQGQVQAALVHIGHLLVLNRGSFRISITTIGRNYMDKLYIEAKQWTKETDKLVLKTGKWPSSDILMYYTDTKLANKICFNSCCFRNGTFHS